MTTASARTGFVFPAEKGPQSQRNIRITPMTSTVSMANRAHSQFIPTTDIGAVEQQHLNPAKYRTWADIQRPNQFKPIPDDTQHRRNQGILTDYVRRSDRQAATNLPRNAVAGARTFQTRVVTGPNYVDSGVQETIRLTGGYSDPESASSRRWSSRDARGDPVAIRGELQNIFDLEAKDVLLPESRLNALEMEQQNARLFRAFARHSPYTLKPMMMAQSLKRL